MRSWEVDGVFGLGNNIHSDWMEIVLYAEESRFDLRFIFVCCGVGRRGFILQRDMTAT